MNKSSKLAVSRMIGDSQVHWYLGALYQTDTARLVCSSSPLHKHGHLYIYAPTRPSADSAKDTFYQELDSLISTMSAHDVTVIMGDFNAQSASDPQGFEQVVDNYGARSVNFNSVRLLS